MCTKQLFPLRPLLILNLLIIQKPNSRASPHNPSPIMLLIPLVHTHISPSTDIQRKTQHTSFLVTGFSINTKCVNCVKLDSTSKSAISAKLFDASTNVDRLGREFASVGWMLDTRLRARRRVCNRGESGKLPRSCISLSVKSMASCGYCTRLSIPFLFSNVNSEWGKGKALTPATPRFSIAGILCPADPKIRYQRSSPQSVVSCSFQHVPRRSSSRSLSGLR
jgi:hypothetical protein